MSQRTNTELAKLSFTKLNFFSVHNSSLLPFVLIRNALQQQEKDPVEEIWLDACFDQLHSNDEDTGQEQEEEEEEEYDSPLSPEDGVDQEPLFLERNSPTFFIPLDDDEMDQDNVQDSFPYDHPLYFASQRHAPPSSSSRNACSTNSCSSSSHSDCIVNWTSEDHWLP
ncbi:hypothetical protein DFQ30_010789 [Apophysomyces sp. BC1015]|nr:hypothetical protein DFQ30_010789 [Apophysomyces sp. BC1015]KAG0181093.1 hypothetical protein DFQ29_009408 [Apophysomyces sp. BC1021]